MTKGEKTGVYQGSCIIGDLVLFREMNLPLLQCLTYSIAWQEFRMLANCPPALLFVSSGHSQISFVWVELSLFLWTLL